MNRNERHFTRFMRIALMLLMLMPAPAVWAQSPSSQPAAAQDVTIIIQQQQLRFTTQKPVQEMQRQVFNQAGEQTHDSGVSYDPKIDWPRPGADGQLLKSSFYAHTLSIKEADAETARVWRWPAPARPDRSPSSPRRKRPATGQSPRSKAMSASRR